MHTISRFFTVLIIMMVLIPSTIAAPNENANPKAGLKIADLSKGTMKEIKNYNVKGVKTSSSNIIIEAKSKNSITMKDSKPSKVPNEHKKVKVSIPASELQKIDDPSNDGIYGVLETTTDGDVIRQYTATAEQLAAGVDFTFSEVVVNGFSGYIEETFADVESGDILDIPDVTGDYVMTASASGTVPTYTAINRSDASTYPRPSSAISLMPFDSLLDVKTGQLATGAENASVANGALVCDDINTSVKPNGIESAYYKNFTVFAHVNETSRKLSGSIAAGWKSTPTKGFMLGFYPSAGSPKTGSFGISNNVASEVLTYTLPPLNDDYMIAGVYNNTHAMIYVDGVLIASKATAIRTANVPSSLATNSVKVGEYGGSPRGETVGLIHSFGMYSAALTPTEIQSIYAEGSGISFRSDSGYNWTGYNVASGVEKIISTGGTSSKIEFVDTSMATHDVTIRVYYTQDTTKTSQSSDDDFHNISIVHNPGVVITNGTIVRPIAPLYTGTATLDSNNTNAVITQNRTHFTIYTGALTASDWFGYNVSVPNNADHGMWLDTIMRWSNTISGWIFGETAPTDYTNDISDQITVTVS